MSVDMALYLDAIIAGNVTLVIMITVSSIVGSIFSTTAAAVVAGNSGEVITIIVLI